MHLNICVNKDGSNLAKMTSMLDPFVYEYVKNAKGSISAEHGIGVSKIDYVIFIL